MTADAFWQLEQQLKQLHLGAVLDQYRLQAEEAARGNWSYETYLATLIERESDRRRSNRRRRRIEEARFPVLKELANGPARHAFDFEAAPSLNKQQILSLAEGNYLERAEPVLMVGNPGLGKTHLATGLGLAACRQGHRVRFYSTTAHYTRPRTSTSSRASWTKLSATGSSSLMSSAMSPFPQPAPS
jgi:DNA replication protein DnaC